MVSENCQDHFIGHEVKQLLSNQDLLCALHPPFSTQLDQASSGAGLIKHMNK